jgi:hypothetical protein
MAEFHLLFPNARQSQQVWIQTLTTDNDIIEHFGNIEKEFDEGHAKLTPPLTITFSEREVLRFVFYYTVVGRDGQPLEWVRTHAKEHDHL